MGEPNPDLMLSRMTARQYSEWYAFYSECPFFEDRAEHLLAQIAWMLASVNSKKGKQPKFEQFLIFKKPKRRNKPFCEAELRANLAAFEKRQNKS